MVFILSALLGIRIRGLWKLPVGRDLLWGKLGLVLMGGAMFSKSLIRFSVDRLEYVPSPVIYLGTSPVAQTVKRLPTTWETWVWSLGQEDSLEKKMTTHSSILAWKIPWTEKPVGYSPWGHKSQTRLSNKTTKCVLHLLVSLKVLSKILRRQSLTIDC